MKKSIKNLIDKMNETELRRQLSIVLSNPEKYNDEIAYIEHRLNIKASDCSVMCADIEMKETDG